MDRYVLMMETDAKPKKKRNNRPYEIILFHDEPESFGEIQLDILDILRETPGKIKGLNKDSLRKLQARAFVDDFGEITFNGMNCLILLEKERGIADSDIYWKKPSWGATVGKMTQIRNNIRKHRKISPCGCDCDGCPKHCKKRFMTEEERIAMMHGHELVKEEMPDLELD